MPSNESIYSASWVIGTDSLSIGGNSEARKCKSNKYVGRKSLKSTGVKRNE